MALVVTAAAVTLACLVVLCAIRFVRGAQAAFKVANMEPEDDRD